MLTTLDLVKVVFLNLLPRPRGISHDVNMSDGWEKFVSLQRGITGVTSRLRLFYIEGEEPRHFLSNSGIGPHKHS